MDAIEKMYEKHFEAVGYQAENVRLLMFETLVGNQQHTFLFHGRHYRREESCAGGCAFEKDAVLHVAGQIYHVVDGKGVDEPCAHAVVFAIAQIGQRVHFGSAVAHNFDAE